MKNLSLLDMVRAALSSKTPKELAELAVALGVNYATLVRMRDGIGDPAFGRVQHLARLLKLVR